MKTSFEAKTASSVDEVVEDITAYLSMLFQDVLNG